MVPFPFTDRHQTKKRPALVLSSTEHQRENEHATLAMITTASHTAWHGDHKIRDLESTGLKAESIVRQKIFTLDIRLIDRTIGSLGNPDRRAVNKKLNEHLELSY